MAAQRILGEGQLSLTKFLLVTDARLPLKNFRPLLTHILERADFATDLFVFSNVSQDTLDYSTPKVNEGSKAILMGLGDKRFHLPSAPRANCGIRPSGASMSMLPGCWWWRVRHGRRTIQPCRDCCVRKPSRDSGWSCWSTMRPTACGTMPHFCGMCLRDSNQRPTSMPGSRAFTAIMFHSPHRSFWTVVSNRGSLPLSTHHRRLWRVSMRCGPAFSRGRHPDGLHLTGAPVPMAECDSAPHGFRK